MRRLRSESKFHSLHWLNVNIMGRTPRRRWSTLGYHVPNQPTKEDRGVLTMIRNFFFLKMKNDIMWVEQIHESLMLTHSWRQPRAPVVGLDLPCREGGVPTVPCAHLKSKRHVATVFAAAHPKKTPHPPRLFEPFLREERLLTSRKLGQLGDERLQLG